MGRDSGLPIPIECQPRDPQVVMRVSCFEANTHPYKDVLEIVWPRAGGETIATNEHGLFRRGWMPAFS
jgi:hypothetical protein